MKRYKISLNTMTNIQDFIHLAEKFPKDSLRVSDNDGHEVSAQSLIGVLYSLEWNSTYLYSKDDDAKVYDIFARFMTE